MSELVWLAVALVVIFLGAGWIAFTATRLDRLHIRLDAAYSALDAALVRRSAALLHVAEIGTPQLDPALAQNLTGAAQAALAPDGNDREQIENSVSKAVNELGQLRSSLPGHLDVGIHDITESSARVVMARRFYNDAVRDTRSLRARAIVRLLHLAGHRQLPDFFDIDDSTTMTLTYPVPSTSRLKGSTP